jgi:Arc/MetJ family transcription regulator
VARARIDIDEDACIAVMQRWGLSTPTEAVNLALRLIAARPRTLEEALAMEGSGWDADLEELRS